MTETAIEKSKLNVLIIDDDPLITRTMLRLLHSRGDELEVVTADDVEMAFAAADKLPFDIIVTDIDMPDGSGFDLVRKIESLPSTKFIFMSGAVTEQRKLEAQDLGGELCDKINLSAIARKVSK